MDKLPGNFLIDTPKVGFMTILGTYGAIPRSDSMAFVESMEKLPGIFLTDSMSAGVFLSILSTN